MYQSAYVPTYRQLELHEAVLSGSDKHLDATIEKVSQGKKSRRHLLNQYVTLRYKLDLSSVGLVDY